MRTITICLEKGGTGKTLIAKELACGLAEMYHQRVLNCDMDPQGNLTKGQLKLNDPLSIKNCELVMDAFQHSDKTLGNALDLLKRYFVESSFDNSMATVLREPKRIHEAILKTDIAGLDILPATHELTESDMNLKVNCQSNPCGKLTRALMEVEDEYDFVIIDNPPFTNALLYNSIYACRRKDDLVIIPISIDSGGLEGLYTTLTDLIQTADEAVLDFDFRILPVMVQGNMEDRVAVQMLKEIFPGRVFESKIRFQGKPVKKSSLNRYSLVLSNQGRKASVTDDLRNFVKEVWELYQE